MPENGIIDTSHFNDSESFIDNTVSTISSSPRANVIIEDEISKSELALGGKAIVKKSSRYYEQLESDGSIYEV